MQALTDPALERRLLAQLTPSAFYMRQEDNLRLTAFNSAASVELAVRTRFLTPEGEIVAGSDRLVPTTARAASSQFVPTTEGWLIGVEVIAVAGTPRVGQCFVVLDVVRGDATVPLPLACLLQGYVTDTSRLSFPGSPIRSSIEGPGVLRSITGTNPAANAEISEAVPTNARWRVHAVRFTLVTDANVANREVALTLDDGAAVFARSPSRFSQAAGLTVAYSIFFDSALEAIATDTERTIRLPRLDLQGGHRFNTVTTNRQVGDDFSAPQYLVEEWIED
jgi:hypothetical protein